VIYTDEDRATALGIHQNDLRTTYYRALLVSKWCNDEFLGGTMISLLPVSLLHLVREEKNTCADDILAVANWFKQEFTKLKDNNLTADEGRDGSDSEDLMIHIIPRKKGTAHQLNQLLIALLRALKFQVRYVIAIDPASFKPNQHPDIAARAKKETDNKKRKKTLPGQNGRKARWARTITGQLGLTSNISILEQDEIPQAISNQVIDLLSDEEDDTKIGRKSVR
jgi:hypothetical protein